MDALSLMLTAAVITQQPAPASGASLARLLAEQARLAALQAPSAAQLGAELTQLQALLAPSAAQLSELSRLHTLQAPSAVQAADLARLAAAQVELSAVQLAQADGLWDLVGVQDPADSLWRTARRAFNRGEYTNAANLFDDLTRRYAASRYAGDAHYWGAFALYRTGDDQNLRRALTVLDAQKRRYPQALTMRDAPTLRVRILTALARRGDQAAAAELSQQAQPAQPVQPAQPTQPVEPVQPPSASGGAGRNSTTGCPNEDDDDDIRAQALNGLLQMDAANAVPILKRVLAKRDPCSAGLRRKAVFILSQKRGEDVEDILLDVARNDPDQEVRGQAVFWLSQVPSPRAVEMLDSILRTSPDEEIQKKAVFALSQQQNPRAGEILRAYAERPGVSTEVVGSIIFWLGQRRGTENAAFLRGLYTKLTDEDLKEKVIFSLAQQGGNENGRWLMDLALNEREPIEMRKKALFWVGQSGDKSVAGIGELVGLYDRIQNHEMKEQLIFVYSQRHEPEALDKLIDIVRHEQDKELRKKALFWVGQSHDPRAARLLEEIINQ